MSDASSLPLKGSPKAASPTANDNDDEDVQIVGEELVGEAAVEKAAKERWPADCFLAVDAMVYTCSVTHCHEQAHMGWRCVRPDLVVPLCLKHLGGDEDCTARDEATKTFLRILAKGHSKQEAKTNPMKLLMKELDGSKNGVLYIPFQKLEDRRRAIQSFDAIFQVDLMAEDVLIDLTLDEGERKLTNNIACDEAYDFLLYNLCQ